jgi:hypothetical protein
MIPKPRVVTPPLIRPLDSNFDSKAARRGETGRDDYEQRSPKYSEDETA